ncbi:MAG: hypothetical protein ACWGO1_05520, partial [Anaerolineales bacterium]
TNITLTGGPLGNEGYTLLNPQDSLTFMLSEDAVFVLRAINGNQQALRTVEVRLRHAVPQTPYNLSGQVTANPNPPPDSGILLTWAYDNENAILGYRLYRNTGSGFSIIANEDQLGNLTQQYLDLTGGNCMTYYVVAVYQNASGQRQETNPSNQWNSTCP